MLFESSNLHNDEEEENDNNIVGNNKIISFNYITYSIGLFNFIEDIIMVFFVSATINIVKTEQLMKNISYIVKQMIKNLRMSNFL